MTSTTAGLQAAREEKERQRVRLMELDYQARSGRLIDREAAERAIFARARMERDSWLAFVARLAPALAAALGAEERLAFQVLDRLIREHLDELATVELEMET